MQERLDRAVSNAQGSLLFPNFTVKHLTSPSSDYSPLMVDTEGAALTNSKTNRRRRKHIEAMWIKEKEASDIMKACWQWDHGPIASKLERAQKAYHDWAHD